MFCGGGSQNCLIDFISKCICSFFWGEGRKIVTGQNVVEYLAVVGFFFFRSGIYKKENVKEFQIVISAKYLVFEYCCQVVTEVQTL